MKHINTIAIKKSLQEGDVIFSSVANFLYKAVEKGTNSPTSHVGIVIKKDEQWLVAESKVPLSRLSTLDEFIARSDQGWISIKRLKSGLSSQQLVQLKNACNKRLGRLYDFSFNYASSKLFCSKFVYEVFMEAMNIEVGEIETFSALIDKSPRDIINFWRMWFCGFIPFNGMTITPHSQWLDPKFDEVITGS